MTLGESGTIVTEDQNSNTTTTITGPATVVPGSNIEIGAGGKLEKENADGGTTTITGPAAMANDGSVTVGQDGTIVSKDANGSTLSTVTGPAVVNADGSVTVNGGGKITTGEGEDAATVTVPTDTTVTIPADKLDDVKADDQGNITLPAGSTITNGNNTATVPENTTITVPADKLDEVSGNSNGSITVPGGSTVTNTETGKETAIPSGSTGTVTGDSVTTNTPTTSRPGGSTNRPSTSTTTEKNPDGSTTTTTTDKTTGTVTETTKYPDGTVVTEETKKDGTVTETTKNPDGTTTTVVTDKKGDITEVEATVPSSAVQESEKTGEPVTLPVEVPNTKDSEDAPAIKVDVPKGGATVEIPVDGVTPGTVVVIVGKDGKETVVPMTQMTANGVVVTLTEDVTIKVIDNSKVFSDVSADHPFADAVAFASARGIIEGYANGTFGIANPATVNAAVVVVARTMGQEFYGATAVAEALAWAAEMGLTEGLDLTGNVTRETYMILLWRAAGMPVADLSVLNQFSDVSGLGDIGRLAMAWAVENGLIEGYSDGTVRPDGQITRGAMAAIAMRYIQLG